MITSEVLSAVFAAQDGNVNATQMLYQLVESPESDKCSIEEQCQKLTLSYDLLVNLVRLSQIIPNEIVIEFLQKTVGNVTKDKYIECVNILRFYGYTLLVKYVENNWQKLPENLKHRCKYDAESLFSYNRSETTVLSEYSSLVNQKTSQYISSIAVREWPGEWKELIPLCIKSINQLFTKLGSECKNNQQALNEIAVFWGIISEISVEIKECLEETILHKRRIQISNMLKTYIYDILLTIHRVMVLGIVNTNQQLSYMILTIFRNLSSILDGFIFISFEVDDFMVANIKTVKRSEIIQTISNICIDVTHKKLKNLTVVPEFDLTNEQIYKVKLDRFMKNMVIISENFGVDMNYNTTLEQLQMAQAFKTLLEKNSLYLIENMPSETLRMLFEYLMTRMVMHPSIEVSTCTLNACSLLLRRIMSIKVKKNEDIEQKIMWLDHKKFLLCLFIRGLKLGNPLVSKEYFTQNRVDVSPIRQNITMTQGNIYGELCILDGIIANVTNKFKGVYEWVNCLFNYCKIDEEMSVGQMKNFEARFAALRSTILHCCSLVAIISPNYMESVLMVVGDLMSNLSKELDKECMGYCCNYRKNERQLNYICNKYILLDGVLFILESSVFRLRSMTIDLTGGTNTNTKDEKNSWMKVEIYKNIIDLNNITTQITVQGININWIKTAMKVMLNLVGIQMGTSHRYMLEIRRLDTLASMSILFIYNAQFLGNILELIVSKTLFEINNNISNLNKCALQCLTVFCKNCKNEIGPYLEVIVSKIHHCLSIVTNENSKDLLLESLVSLITTNRNNVNNKMVREIISNYIKQLEQVNTNIGKIGDVKKEIIWEENKEIKTEYSENLYNYLFKNKEEINEVNKKNLHRTVTMCYSIIRKIANNINKTRIEYIGEEEMYEELYKYTMNILLSFINFWKIDFFNNNSERKTLLSPGKDEWLSLQGFNEAIANEDNLEQIVESVFNITKKEEAQKIRSTRRYVYILRQSLLKLTGELIQAVNSFKINQEIIKEGMREINLKNKSTNIEIFENYIISIIEWVPVFHLYQIIKYTLVPCIFSLTKINIILNRLQERINQEWKSLNLFKATNNETTINTNFKEKEEPGVQSKIIQLYYLKVYACIDCGIEILNMCIKLINNKNVHYTTIYEHNEVKEDIIKEDVMREESIDEIEGTKVYENGKSILNQEEIIHAVLSCLCSSLSWPHIRTINESLRIMRIYARMTHLLNTQLHIKFIYQLILYLNKNIIVPRTFNPLEIGCNGLEEGENKDGSKNNHIKEYVNTICTLYESITKCFPQILSVVKDEEVNIQELLSYHQVVETLKLLTPYLQEQDCIEFIKYILLQKSFKSRTLLKNSIQEKIKGNNHAVYLAQFNKSSLETKSSTEIEIQEKDNDEDPLLGKDILYLLLE